MNSSNFRTFFLAVMAFAAFGLIAPAVRADPLLSSWLTTNSTKYARIYTSPANRTAGVSTTTWTGQTSPTYAGIHEINYSANWVYLKNTGLASYVMGPWNNPNLPKNQGTATKVYRFPRTPVIPATKTLTGMGVIGVLVDGVSIYNTSDGFSYSVANGKDATPNGGIGAGDGIWNRDAWPNEFVSFDYALNHPQPSGDYHSHANPIAVRYQLGDNVNYDAATKIYSENTATTTFAHSPIIGWMNDGLPYYGPYGYSNPLDATSPVRRMVSGYVLRDGSYGTTNLTATGRTTLPAWALAAQNRAQLSSSAQYGPAVNTTYALGHFSEDYDYLGDLGFTQGTSSTVGAYTTLYDLNKYNVRYCVTPEFPNGTWAYFATISSTGAPWYPYNAGRWYYGTKNAAASTTTVMNADTPLTQYYKGAASTAETWTASPVTVSGSAVTISWNAVEGGTYQVSATSDLATWTNLAPTVTATGGNSAGFTETDATSSSKKRFYKITRTGLATYDSVGY